MHFTCKDIIMSPIDSDAFFSVENSLYPHPEEDEETRRRRWAGEQATANCKIAGFEPSAEFLEQSERIVRGEITPRQAIEEILAEVKDYLARNGNAK
jgi:hypothetical protein